ncbi:MAG: mismatch-specific DNA-glycosylase [Halanaerobiales bacterium]|nr:mismatch-specific DNA-glycosylase [Halanaerobiales bacterium]
MKTINDYLKPNLKVIFIGFNPGITSSKTGYHYAHPTNRFYKLLFAAKLTDRLYKPEEDFKLLKLGYGLTNIVNRPTKSASDIKKEEYEKGRLILLKKLKRYKPQIACFTGIKVYKEFAELNSVKRGLQEIQHISGLKEFVVSSPSGLNRTPYQKQLKMYKILKDSIK